MSRDRVVSKSKHIEGFDFFTAVCQNFCCVK